MGGKNKSGFMRRKGKRRKKGKEKEEKKGREREGEQRREREVEEHFIDCVREEIIIKFKIKTYFYHSEKLKTLWHIRIIICCHCYCQYAVNSS